MDIELSDPIADSSGIASSDVAALRRITAEQLLSLGKRQIAYLKSGLREGKLAFILVGADGVPVAIVESIIEAARAAVHMSLELVAVH